MLRRNKGVRFAHGTMIGRGLLPHPKPSPQNPPPTAATKTDRNTVTEKPKGGLQEGVPTFGNHGNGQRQPIQKRSQRGKRGTTILFDAPIQIALEML